MTTIPMSDIPEWSKSYHGRIEAGRDLCEPTANILMRESGLRMVTAHALKPDQPIVIRGALTQYSG